ncbi:TlpA family protein disulfide reductase [Silvibacterium sp.]|uniref:TlpA family protein disulfide reductase n=1 Tax=Silvibacterium sp. TaxID=1964179 RepID=UPI0039E44CAC
MTIWRRGLSLCAAAALLACSIFAISGCNRGDHPAQVGELAPNFTIQDEGRTVSLDQYRGKTVVLNFWASWCVYCIQEFPSMEQLQNKIPNLVVLAVAFDSEPADYRQYIQDNHLTNMVITLDRSQKSNLAFGTTRPPESYVIDPSGRIRRKFIGPADWSSPEIQSFLRSL